MTKANQKTFEQLKKQFDKSIAMLEHISNDNKQMRKTSTTTFHANQILAQNHIKYDIDTADWYMYNKNLGYYDNHQAEYDINCKIKDYLGDGFTKHKQKEIIEVIRLQTGFNAKECDGKYICVKNGLINTTTFELEQHSPDKFVSFRLDVEYQPDIDMTEWNSYVIEVFDEYATKIQQAMGDVFDIDYVTKKAIYIVGNKNSGKTTFCTIVLSLFNDYDYTTVGLLDLDANQYALADLHNKKLNMCSEMDYKMTFKGITIVNKLTGNDKFTTRQIYKPSFQFTNTAKLFFSGNGVPYVNGANQAFWGRWEFIVCKNMFPVVDGIKEKYTTPEMKSCILNWMIDGYKQLKANNWVFDKATTPEEVMKFFSNAEASEDGFLMWLQSRCIASIEDSELKIDLCRDCLEWCRERGVKGPSNIDRFGEAMHKQRLIPIENFRPRDGDERKNAYRGIKLKLIDGQGGQSEDASLL